MSSLGYFILVIKNELPSGYFLLIHLTEESSNDNLYHQYNQ